MIRICRGEKATRWKRTYFQDPADELRVLAGLRLVDFVVAAHDGTYTSVDGLGEWPEVELVHRAVVNVG